VKWTNTKHISLILALFIAVISAIAIFILHEVKAELLWIFAIIAILLIFILSYLAFKYFLDNYLLNRIRLIYKMIRSEKLSAKEKPRSILSASNDLEDAGEEVVKWARERRKEIEELKLMADYRREYVGNVSHELKTPIFNIQGYVLTLLDGGMEDPSINKKYLLKCEESIDRMISIIDDLEEISKLESGELAIHLTKINLLVLCKKVISFLEFSTEKKNTEIYFRENYEKPIYVMADEKRITQVLSNLIENAIKYTNENGKIKISFFDMVDHYLIEITDNGIGMESHEIPRLFERFYRTEKSRNRKQGGTGLGLAIVKHIIEAHGQTINVRSKSGFGSTFAFTLKKAK